MSSVVYETGVNLLLDIDILTFMRFLKMSVSHMEGQLVGKDAGITNL